MRRGAVTTLADVSESVRYGYTASARTESCGPRFLRITDIVSDALNWDTVPFCEITDEDKARFSLAVGDIVVARTGATVGYAKLIREVEDAVFASYLVRFRIDPNKAIPAFVGHLIESDLYKAFVKSRIGGAAQPNASAPVLGSFEFTLPPKPSQERIASILCAYDELMNNNRQRMALLEKWARLLYEEWFVRLRFPGHEHTEIIHGVPRGWEPTNLGAIVYIAKGKNITKETTEGGNVPVVAGGLEPAYYHSLANAAAPVITVSASGANAGYVNIYHENIWASDCSYISASATKHVYYIFNLMRFRQLEIFGMQKGAAQPHVYPKDLKRLEICQPPERLISLFTDTVSPAFALIANLGKQNQKLRTARDLLLPRLLSGEFAI